MSKWEVNEGLDWADRIERMCKKEDGHWLWQGYVYNESTESPGWPQYMVRNSDGPSHLTPRQVIWEKYRKTSGKGKALRVSCGFSNCLNPEHLYAPTKSKDKIAQQKANTEAKNKRARLIRELQREGVLSQNRIAEMVGVHESTVSRIVNGSRRKEV